MAGGWTVVDGGEKPFWAIMCAASTDEPRGGVVRRLGNSWYDYRGASWPTPRAGTDRRNIPREVVEAFADRDIWARRWVCDSWARRWVYGEGGECAVTDVLQHAAFWPKSIWHDFDGDRVRVTYSVTPWDVRNFAREMAAAFRMARRAGLDLRWVKERR